MAPINGGNEGGLDTAIFLFCWRCQGDCGGGRRPASGGAVLARLRCGRKKKVVGWAVQVGWASREAEAQWEGEGKSAGKKKRLGRKARWAESDGENSFLNKI
jgi:hypothetical protein